MIYPTVETFLTIQGEGALAGALEFFVRLAGCNVGRFVEPKSSELRIVREQNPGYSVCRGVLGTEMICDTYYKAAEKCTAVELIERAGSAQVIRITGGEPCMYDLRPLIAEAEALDKEIRIETSGSLPLKNYSECWISCCPKEGFDPSNYPFVDEWRFLVEAKMGTPASVVASIRSFLSAGTKRKLVFISPISGIKALDQENINFAVDVIKEANTSWRLSVQVHKIIHQP